MRMKLFFNHQENGELIALANLTRRNDYLGLRYEQPIIVFPKGFTPRQGFRYEVKVFPRDGDGKTYIRTGKLYEAYDAVALSEPNTGDGTMAAALRGAGLVVDTSFEAAFRKAAGKKTNKRR